MKYYIVALATIFAMFWDEAMISLISVFIKQKIDPLFMISWIICSGILTSILISYHVSYEYRIITLLLVSVGVIFSINGYKLKEEYNNIL
jgi:hypothetical protein